MNWKSIVAIARKDLLEARGNQAVWVPMVLVPLIFVLFIPAVVLILPLVFHLSPAMLGPQYNPDLFLKSIPANLAIYLAGLDEIQTMVMVVLGFLFAPMFLIFPLMFSVTIAAESFAGERERKTMEALLYSPATDSELFAGKVLAGVTPAVLVSWLSFIGYTIVVNAAGYPLFGRIWFPLPTWYPLIFWITPALAVFGVALTVLISTRSQTFMGAYQTATGSVVLVLLLMIGQVTGLLYLDVLTGMIVGVVGWILAGVTMVFAIRTFNRTKLLASAS